MVKLFYGKGVPNVGDYYSYWLAEKLYKNVKYAESPNLIIAGSILAFPCLNNETLVGGAGLHNFRKDEVCRITNKDNFRAVRGKLTAEKLGLDLNKVVLGDPGILVSRFFNYEVQNKKDYCILAHWKDYNRLVKDYGNYVDVINMATNDVESILRKINSYKLVLSSSLHGLIFAHSYGIPALYVEGRTPESKDYFKFKDYYSTLNIPFKHYKLTSNGNEDLYYIKYLDRATLCPSPRHVKAMQDRLLSVLPKEEELDRKPFYNNVICAIAKNENEYINDWVNFHLRIGFDHIYLFDNNDSKTHWVGKCIEKSDKVTIFNINDIHESGLQLKCYNEFYEEYKNSFNGCLFIDIDEYLFGINNFDTFIHNSKFRDYEMVRFKGKLFNDSNLIDRDMSKPVYEVFRQVARKGPLNQAKCAVRGGLSNICVGSCHYAFRGDGQIEKLEKRDLSNVKPLKQCLPSGKECHSRISITEDYSSEQVFVHHYMTKSLSEFIKQKVNRGDACFENRDIKFDYYWSINDKTPEKENYIKQVTEQIITEQKEIKKKREEQQKDENAKYKKILKRLEESGLPSLEDSLLG